MASDLIVIPTLPGDIHAIAVSEAIKRLGLRCWLWNSSYFNSEANINIDFDENFRISVSDCENNISFRRSDVIAFWNRRVRDVVINKDINSFDQNHAHNNSKRFRSSIISLLNQSSRRVNDFYRANAAENKALQLHTAFRCNLSIPKTMMSNDANQIKKFIKDNKSTVAKSFVPASWGTSNGIVTNLSALVEIADIPSEFIMRSDPMIFQEYVEKAFEVRITWFGSCPLAIKLDSQADDRSRIDWRSVSPSTLSIEPVEIPKSILEKCIHYMEELDLVFCCMDFIVTEDEQWIFLEANQMGQFLWIEEANNEIPMLDCFLQLLVTGEKNVVPRRQFGIHLSAIYQEAYIKRIAMLDKYPDWQSTVVSQEATSI